MKMIKLVTNQQSITFPTIKKKYYEQIEQLHDLVPEAMMKDMELTGKCGTMVIARVTPEGRFPQYVKFDAVNLAESQLKLDGSDYSYKSIISQGMKILENLPQLFLD